MIALRVNRVTSASVNGRRRHSDEDLRRAVESATSWAEVFAALGLTDRPSGGVAQTLRDRAAAIGVGTAHLKGRRRGPRIKWSDADLETALRECESWDGVCRRLRAGDKTVRRRAAELGLDTSQVDQSDRSRALALTPRKFDADPVRQAYSAEALAIAWYTVHGYEVFVPFAGDAQADLIALKGAEVARVQVKWTNMFFKGRYEVAVSRAGRYAEGGAYTTRRPYDPAAVTEFFIVTGNGDMYLVPREAVAGKLRIRLGEKYDGCKVDLNGWQGGWAAQLPARTQKPA